MGIIIRVKSCKFFYRVLIGSPPDVVSEYVGTLEKSAESLEKQITDMVVYSEGTIRFQEGYTMCYSERERVIKTLNERYEKLTGKEYL